MRITFFKLGKLLGLQNTFSITRGFFETLRGYNSKGLYRFEFKSARETIGLKLLERNGFDNDLVEVPERLCGRVPQISEIWPLSPKEFRGLEETANKRRFLIPDEGPGCCRGGGGLGCKISG